MLRYPSAIALGAGILSALGFAPLSLWPLTLIAFALLLWITHQAPNLKRAMWRGWLFGVAHFTVGNNWIQHAFNFQDKMPPALGYLAVLLLALYLAVYPAIFAGLAWRFRGKSGPNFSFILVAGAAWIASEYLRSAMFTGYAWSPLSVIWLPVPGVVQLVSFIGTYALSGLTILVAGSLYLAATRKYIPLIGSAAATLTFAILLHPGAPVDDPSRPLVRVVQPNLDQSNVGEATYASMAVRKLMALSGKAGDRPRLIAWPEGMVHYYLEEGYADPRYYYRGDPRQVRADIASMLGPQDRLLFGGDALFFDEQRTLKAAGNSVWPLDPDGMLGKRYDKAHLVPYGEYLPMRGLLEPLGVARLVMGDVDYAPGPGPTTLPVAGFGNVGVAICYEIIFSGQIVDRANRPDLIFNPSNDAWFGAWGPPQHLAQARLRAIEEGLPILRSTPNGISAVIDGKGRLLGTVPAKEAGAVEVTLPAPLAAPLFARIGNLLALIFAVALFASAVALRLREE